MRTFSWLLLVMLWGCSSPVTDDVSRPPEFVDVATQTGIDFVHSHGAHGAYHYPETFGSGAAWLDTDGDGWLDLYLVNSGDIEQAPSPAGANQLWRNTGADGVLAFINVTEMAKAGDQGYGMGATSADVDANGQVDIFVTNVGANTLLMQTAGRYASVGAAVGVADPSWATAAAFFDADMDGDLDLVVINYVVFELDDVADCRQGRVRTYCDPDRYEPTTDLLYRNDGTDGGLPVMTEISLQAGLTGLGRGLGLALQDVDLDGDTDLYVANDGTANLLYENRTTMGSPVHLAEIGLQSGTRFNRDGRAEAGMGTDFGDINGDGWPELVVANFSRETNTLYRHAGDASSYSDATVSTRLAQASFQPLGFGLAFFDADADGDLDLAVANGHVLDRAADVDAGSRYEQPDQLFLYGPEGFVESSESLGAAWSEPRVSRALAPGDFDNDGDEDLLITSSGASPRLLRNDIEGGGWLSLTLQATAAGNHQGLGARVEAELPDGSMLYRQLHDGGSYLSGRARRIHLALGSAPSAVITVRWPGGGSDDWTLTPGAHLLVQGQAQ